MKTKLVPVLMRPTNVKGLVEMLAEGYVLEF